MTEKKKKSGEISRREFLKDAGLLVGGTAIGSTVLLAACGDGEGATETVTKTQTVTETATATSTVEVDRFICPSCGTEFDSLSLLKYHFEAAHPGEEAIPGLIALTVNGRTYELKVEPNWTLLDILREKLGLTGAKLSCDRGACGCCAVFMDGRPILSCMVLAIECDGKDILTIEGLEKDGKLHPIQEVFIVNNASQCGYCIPGIIISAKALLDKNPSPDEEEVKIGLSGVICRCGVYPKVVKAVMDAATIIRGGD